MTILQHIIPQNCQTIFVGTDILSNTNKDIIDYARVLMLNE